MSSYSVCFPQEPKWGPAPPPFHYFACSVTPVETKIQTLYAMAIANIYEDVICLKFDVRKQPFPEMSRFLRSRRVPNNIEKLRKGEPYLASARTLDSQADQV